MSKHALADYSVQKLFVWFALILVFLGKPALSQEVSDVDTRRLYESTCTQCHSLSPIEATRNGRRGWEDTVHKMVSSGAQLSVDEMEIIIDYLAERFGPGAGPMRTGLLPPTSPLQSDGTVSSETMVLPAGDGRQNVQVFCHMCHDLGRVVATRKSAEDWHRYTENMLAKGGLKPSPEQFQSIVSYLTEHFGAED